MNNKFLVVVAAGAVVSLVTYFGLNYVKPYHKQEAVAVAAVTVDEVFSGGLTDAPEGAAAAEAPAQEAAAAPASDTPVEATAPDQPPPAEQAAAEPATEPPPAPAAEEAAPAPAVEEPVAAAEPPPPPKAEPKPAPKPAPAAPKAEKPAAKPAAAKAWWPSNTDASKLGIRAVTSASDKTALVVAFDGGFDSADAANASISVSDSKGAKVKGQWEVSSRNPNVLFFAVAAKGRYTVALKGDLQDRKGRALGQDLRGPVEVK